MQSINYKNTEAYKKMTSAWDKLKSLHLRDMFKADPDRFEKFHVQAGDLLFDYSKNRIDEDAMHAMFELADAVGLRSAIHEMFSGEKINKTENRAVLHTALRSFSTEPLWEDGKDIRPEINAVLKRMRSFSDAVHSGNKTGYTGKKIRDVVNIGIGGSDLGPVMVCEALKFYAAEGIQVHFISNVDGTHITETLKKIHPETTLFLIASKTFTTQETMANAHSAREWFLQHAQDEKFIAAHFVALSTAKNEVMRFGIDPENMFEFWDWVGGRYSLWSAIGLSICLAVGYSNFELLLKGAYAADEHFRQATWHENIPVLMALIGCWNIDMLGCNTQAIIPYDQYLHRFAAYLQQADMESNGKYVDRNGNKVSYSTGPVIWGEPGTNGQHAFFQLIHQGTQIIPCDFIAPANSLNKTGEHHQLLMSNFFAQTEALMNGKTLEEVTTELLSKGMSEEEVAWQAPYRVFEGNRPTNTFLVRQLNPYTLGMLIAFYEHKIFTQGVIWNIFSFDQWGVELGKKLALHILPELKNKEFITSHDASTNHLINAWKSMRD